MPDSTGVQSTQTAKSQDEKGFSLLVLVLIIIFGIILPYIALSVELVTHMCASVFFDPIPTLPAALAVALVPISNTLTLIVMKQRREDLYKLCGIANGVAFCVTIFFGVLFLPLLPLSLIALIFFGIGMLPLSPILAFIVTWNVRKKLRYLLKRQSRSLIPADIFLSAFLAISAVWLFPANLTRACEIDMGVHPNHAASDVLLLRALGDSNVLLRSCYGLEDTNLYYTSLGQRLLGLLSSSRFDFDSWSSMESSKAREFFYRVTGKNFNAVPKPSVIPSDRFVFEDESFFSYDSDFAGEAVGGVVRGIKLDRSSITGECDPDSAVEHLTWTMNINKTGYDAREFRTQILLPPGAVVSGAWIVMDGKRHEAVFQAKQSARIGYENEVRQGRPGLLIASAGPSRILLQSSALTSSLNIGLRIDCPMILKQKDRAEIVLPSMIERNFESACKTEVSIERVSQNAQALRYSEGKIGEGLYVKLAPSFKGTFDNAELFAGAASSPENFRRLSLARDAQKSEFVANDPHEPKQVVKEFIQAKVLERKPVIVVLDGSRSMETCMPKLCQSLRQLSSSDVTLIWASDKPSVVADRVAASSRQWSDALARMQDSACVGGQDNAEALALAVNKAKDSKGAYIVWLHGPQAIQLDKSLAANWNSVASNSTLFEYQAISGPNQLLKLLEDKPGIQIVGHSNGLLDDLSCLFAQLEGKAQVIESNFAFAAKTENTVENAPQFIAQVAANQKVNAVADSVLKGQLAEAYQIVTAHTSAVVLFDQPEPEKITPSQSASPSASLSHQASAKESKAKPVKTNAQNPGNSSADSTKPDSLVAQADAPKDAAKAKTSPTLFSIPTKPEPPMNLLMFCVFLSACILIWKQRKQIYR
jgi:hypothetical protein